MIDIHTHILPTVDDGADSADEALEMVDIAAVNGTKGIVLTPHHLTEDSRSLKFSKDRLFSEFQKFKGLVCDEFPDISLYFGAENHIGQNVPPRDMLISINGTEYVLVEFDFNCSFSDALQIVNTLKGYGFKPIIAHPERYEFIKLSPFCAADLVNEGALLQLNVTSLYQGYDGVFETAMFLLSEGLYSFAASDCHSVYYRIPDMSEGYAFISSQFSDEIAENLFIKNPALMLAGKNI